MVKSLLKDKDGNVVSPATITDIVYDSQGKNVDQLLNEKLPKKTDATNYDKILKVDSNGNIVFATIVDGGTF